MIEVVGVQADGVPSLPPATRLLVQDADVVIGSPRLLATLPAGDQRRLDWPRPLLAGLDDLLSGLSDADRVVVLATGDPLDSGIGTTLINRLGAHRVRIHPAVGSVALARARMGWSTREIDVLSLVSTPSYAVRSLLTPGRRLLLLSADETTPAEVAREIADAGWTARITVLGDLGSDDESRHELSTHVDAEDFDGLPRLNIVAVELAEGRTVGTSPGRPDAAYDNDGQLTKREVRACALAALRPAPGQLLWDLGAGAGSVAIEWALHDPRCRAIAVERIGERADRIERNARAAGVTAVRVERAPVSDVIDTLPRPDAVFIGGGADRATIERAWGALGAGGRLVVHTVTIDTEHMVIEAMQRHGGELRRISIERAEPLGRYLSWKPARPVVEWSVTREEGTD